MSREQHTIDAKGKSLGRIASDAASFLRGKNRADFAPNVLPDISVVITNADQMRFTGKKFSDKQYMRYSGYPGGLKTQTLAKRYVQNPAWVVRHAIEGMLPKNRLRKKILKRLVVQKSKQE